MEIRNKSKRGILVDRRGTAVTGLVWKPGTAPKMPRGYKLITDEKAVKRANTGDRWDQRRKKWVRPNKTLYLVGPDGGLRGRVKAHGDDLPEPPFDHVYVTVAPPTMRGRRAIWTGKKWEFPRRIAIVAKDGSVVNTVLENPRKDQPDVDIPDGHKGIDIDKE